MKVPGLIVLMMLSFGNFAVSQTCTLTGSGTVNWTNSLTCTESGVTPATASVLVIPEGMTLVFDSNGDTWTGARIDVFGTLTISQSSGIEIFANIRVKGTGSLDIDSRLYLGGNITEAEAENCNYNVVLEDGASMTVEGNSSDRLYVCGKSIIQDGGQCYQYPGEQLPYCSVSGGFSGPTGFDKTGENVTLPVTWLSFTTRNIDNKSVHLAWATASELNAESFIIERSSNGKEYFPIGTKAASGNSSVRQDYTFTDTNPFIGRTYYRLRQVDYDGAFGYSEIRFIDLTGRRAVHVFPNPLEEDELNVQLNFSDEDEVLVSVYDVSGLEIDKFSFYGAAFKKPLQLNAGSYLLRAKTGKENLVCRFVVR